MNMEGTAVGVDLQVIGESLEEEGHLGCRAVGQLGGVGREVGEGAVGALEGKRYALVVAATGEGHRGVAFGEGIFHRLGHCHGYGGVIVVEMQLLTDGIHKAVQLRHISIIQLNLSLFHNLVFVLLRLQRYEKFLNFSQSPANIFSGTGIGLAYKYTRPI